MQRFATAFIISEDKIALKGKERQMMNRENTETNTETLSERITQKNLHVSLIVSLFAASHGVVARLLKIEIQARRRSNRAARRQAACKCPPKSASPVQKSTDAESIQISPQKSHCSPRNLEGLRGCILRFLRLTDFGPFLP
jgi:hypothetical protein